MATYAIGIAIGVAIGIAIGIGVDSSKADNIVSKSSFQFLDSPSPYCKQ